MSFDQIFKRYHQIHENNIINCHATKLPFYRGKYFKLGFNNDEKEFGILLIILMRV